ncbi:MAG: SDR family NAD(P)-dependent oxidoreductase [Candidatus Moranbacteria bacterium]|nr:SDR family NAD(P)-dependent oxidoreductase [Candidatus Moranbacteria bacterium]
MILFRHLTPLNQTRLFFEGDLSDNQGTRLLANEIEKHIKINGGVLDLLFNVAGIVRSGYQENVDRNELTFATNHLSVYLLTGLLYPYLKKSLDPRVLVVSSLSHYRACFDRFNLQSKRFYNVLRAYQRSKLYNVLFVKYFARHEKDIKIYAIDPGLVQTEIGDKHTKGIATFVWKLRKKHGVTADVPVRHMVEIATNPSYLTLSGSYLKDGNPIVSSRISYHERKQDFLWEETQKLTEFIYPF